MCELRRHVYANTVDRSTIKRLVRRAFPRCECKKLHQEQQQRNAHRRGEDAFVDLDDLCGDTLDSNMEVELQAVELQYLKDVEAQSQEQNKQVTERVECNDASQDINSAKSQEQNKQATERVECNDVSQDNNLEKAKEHCTSNSARKGKRQVKFIQFYSTIRRVLNVLMIENVSSFYILYLYLLCFQCVMGTGQ